MSDEFNPYSAPNAQGNAPVEAVLAPRGVRFAGAVIDALLLIGVLIGMYYLLGWQLDTDTAYAMKNMLAGIVLFWAVQGWLLFKRGQTVGKLVMKTQIAALDSAEVPTARLILLRYVPMQLAAWLPLVGPYLGIVDALFIFGPQRRCLHDYIAGTRVICRN